MSLPLASRPSVALVTPALASANNGNWQTAQRWARLLAPVARVRVSDGWSGGDEDLLIALHARRSAPSVAAWRQARPEAPLVLVLTGTDLYRDIDHDAAAQASLAAANQLVVLNARGLEQLPPALRPRGRVLLQSCPARQAVAKTARHLRVLMVGHLRDEKDPLTYLRAAERLANRSDLRLDHIGAALDPALGASARATMARCPHYRWLGARNHAATRRAIQHAHVLVHPSRMEGGAHVVIEALRSGTPVIASDIDGNRGLLDDPVLGPWPAVFPAGDDAALAALVARCRDDPAMLPALMQRAAERAPCFAPAHEAATLQALLRELLPDRLPPTPPAPE